MVFEESESDLCHPRSYRSKWERGARSLSKWFFGTSELDELKAIRTRAHPDKQHSSGFISEITWYHLAQSLICVLNPKHECELEYRKELIQVALIGRKLPTPMGIEPDKTNTYKTVMLDCIKRANESLAKYQAALPLDQRASAGARVVLG